jgi:hypothetical protein
MLGIDTKQIALGDFDDEPAAPAHHLPRSVLCGLPALLICVLRPQEPQLRQACA